MAQDLGSGVLTPTWHPPRRRCIIYHFRSRDWFTGTTSETRQGARDFGAVNKSRLLTMPHGTIRIPKSGPYIKASV
jgi:hypothetical protein